MDDLGPQNPQDSDPPTTTNPPTKTGFSPPPVPLPPIGTKPGESEPPTQTSQPPKTGFTSQGK